MKHRVLGAGFILLFLWGCISTKVIKEQFTYFPKYSTDELWQASVEALAELGYEILDKDEWRGFIFAEKEIHPLSTLRLPSQLILHIGKDEENGWAMVSCEAILVGKKADYSSESRRAVSLFIKTLRQVLKGKLPEGTFPEVPHREPQAR